jgi:hypothetical protein
MYGPGIQPQWHTYAQQDCSRQEPTDDVTRDGAQSLSQFEYGQGAMIIENGTTSSASKQATAISMNTNVDGQLWSESDQTGMTLGLDPSGWTGDMNGILNFAGHEGWFDLVNFGG